MLDRRRFALGLLAVLGLALAARALPLLWSPYPATLDGFGYVADAQATIARGSIPLAGFRAEDFVFTSFTITASRVLGVDPLVALQALMIPVGGTAVLAGIALVSRCCDGIGSRRTARLAALLAGLLLAVSGIYLRRTLVPDSDILAHAFVPLLAVAWFRLLRTGRRPWAVVSGVFLVAFPLVHTLSTLLAALTLTGVTVAALVAGVPWRRLSIGAAAVAAFWAYVAGYYWFAGAHPLLTVSYVDRVSAYPGLFLAWIVVLILGIAWFGTTSPRLRQAVAAAPFAVALLALAVNGVTTVFPGTIPTPPGLLPLMSLNLVMVAFAVRVWKRVPARGMVLVVVALLAAPVVVMYFALTASLAPEYFATALRAHTFVYLPLIVLAAIGAATIASNATSSNKEQSGPQGIARRVSLGRGLVAVLVVSTVGTAPLAYADLDTMSYPGTTTPGEFEATGFAAVHSTQSVATDHALSRVIGHFHAGGAGVAPTRQWLRGGPPPDRPTLSRTTWAERGAHFFPGAPVATSRSRYDAAIQCRHLVYATTTRDALALTLPANGSC
ncbi:MAG: sodium/phosphate symporter [Halobacteriales archaeon]